MEITFEFARLRGKPLTEHKARIKGSWRECASVERNPEKAGGVYVFNGTRIPVRALFENLEDGAAVDEFLEWFPGVSRHQVEAVLEFTVASLAEPVAS